MTDATRATDDGTLTVTSVSLHPAQRDGYTSIWVGNNVPDHRVEHWVGRSLTPTQLEALGARRDGERWVLNYMGRDYLLQTGPRDVTHEPVFNEPRPDPVVPER